MTPDDISREPGGFLIPPELASDIIATALSATVLIPDELLSPGARRPLTRRQRFRFKRAEWREKVARAAFRAVAGYWPHGGDDW